MQGIMPARYQISLKFKGTGLAPASDTRDQTMKPIPKAPGAPTSLHRRNRHQGRYDFPALIRDSPELGAYVIDNGYGQESIDFACPLAVKALNRALLKSYYGVTHWDIPDRYLCPPIPGRADYVHYLADILAAGNGGVIPRGPGIRVLDIGVGANGIYPLIAHSEYGWQCVGSDVDAVALASAKAIVESNSPLRDAIDLRLQPDASRIFYGVVRPGEFFDLTLCNPPFHATAREARLGSQRKWRNLGKSTSDRAAPSLNFGGQDRELWYEGGEATFVRRMIDESAQIPRQVLWFSTLISKATNLPGAYNALKKAGALQIQTVKMAQGQKQSRFIAWTFLDQAGQSTWRDDRLQAIAG
jgi:23S rRNA (adenine1618-N6)-methyltransferase